MIRWYHVSGLIPIVILAIVFALPLKTVPVQATETYWNVEISSEPYTATESYTDVEPYTTTETHTRIACEPYIYQGGWPYICNPDTSMKCYNYPYPYCVICSSNQTSSCRIWLPYYNSCGSQPTYSKEVIKYKTVTKCRNVTKYREIPTPVLKERAITEYIRISIWEYLFR